jgi:hypothetical protein
MKQIKHFLLIVIVLFMFSCQEDSTQSQFKADRQAERVDESIDADLISYKTSNEKATQLQTKINYDYGFKHATDIERYKLQEDEKHFRLLTKSLKENQKLRFDFNVVKVQVDDMHVELVRQGIIRTTGTTDNTPDPTPLYPPSETGAYPDSRPWVAPTTYPALLTPFNVATNNLQVTRISDKNMASNPTGFQMRHDYSKDQCWNADGSEIQ